MRPNLRSRLRAKHWARRVLAVPGGPSRRTCPPEKSATSIRSSVSDWPTIAFATSRLMASAKLLTLSTFMNHFPSPTMEFARHTHGIRFIGRTRGFRHEFRQRLRRLARPPHLVERCVEVVVTRVGGSAYDTRDAAPNCRGVARRDAMFAPRHRDQGCRIVGESLFAQREHASACKRRTEARCRVDTHEQRREQRAERGAEQRGLEDKAQQIGRTAISAQGEVENHRAL